MSVAHSTQFEYFEKLPAILFLALFLGSGLAHADDDSLIREANAAWAQKDFRGAYAKFSVLAQHGNATAQFNLGALYLNGQGVQKDEKQAFEWFGKSAAQGNARALQILQSTAAKGNENAKNELNKIQPQPASAQTPTPALPLQSPSVPKDGETLLAEANTALSQKDYNTAFQKFLALAQQGNATAQYNVGVFYLNGQGVQKDETQAYDWFAKSTAQGYASAVQIMQNKATKENDNAKDIHEEPARSTTAAAPLSEPDVKAKTDVTTVASHAGSVQSGESSLSNFSLGVSSGITRKITGVNNSSSLGLLAGYRFNSSFGVEFAYNALYRSANADDLVSASYPGTTGTFDLNSLTVAGQYTYGLGRNMSLLGNLGVHTSSFKTNSSANGSWTGNTRGLVAGLKVQYDLSRNIGIRGGFDIYTESGGINGTLIEVGLAAITRF